MNKKVKFEGVIPALITPMQKNSDIDFVELKNHVQGLMESGITTFMCNGCSGEGIALDSKERMDIIETILKTIAGRGKLIAGAGVATTRETIKLCKDVKSTGVDAAMVITPFMEIPSQEGIYRHFELIAESVDIPIVIYNIPPHTNVNIELETLEKLIQIEQIVAIKDSSGDLSYCAATIQEFGDKISVLTGGDDILVPAFSLGAAGAILAIANIAPRMVLDIYNAIQEQRLEKAKEIYYRLLPLAQSIGSPVNFPASLKEALRLLGIIKGYARSPIVPVGQNESAAIADALKTAGLQ